MKFFCIVSLLVSLSSSITACKIAMGVSKAASGCDEGILSQIKLYAPIIVEAECGFMFEGSTRRLRGADKQDERELDRCTNLNLYCEVTGQPLWCGMYGLHCGARELYDSEEPQDPFNDPGWSDCDMLDYDAWKEHVDEDFMQSYASADIRQCFQHTWCRQNLD
mmetsp:Transcript_262/g.356  ORF Transcript_262/g.356 Transcript_262/m.356 type:complete len:164 (+) Transcript_262:114-605(+)|eukprot:CAMPEP_0198143218 /NCGR_PEP_ID=MMETSP1443-20131203/6083_1 /TAXON_ID=186043 /ORGANISM="Entomoneis sp., Strain CCMP2396" /LENGTH=163 /DNA_ID=CAMNT_0043806409 /DNA_START=73 /DNA_END=564 /DNA_ORIENTATION=-